MTGCFAVRTGKTTGLIAGILARQLNEPGPAGVIVPTDGDARNFMVADLEPVAEASPLARGLFAMEADPRNTMTDRRVPGGSLRIRAAASPRNLAGHTWRDLYMDEVDRFEPTREGSATALAEKRTPSFANRKILMVSTPTYDETSGSCAPIGGATSAFAKSDAPDAATISSCCGGTLNGRTATRPPPMP